MKFREIVNHIEINPEKITEYSLNPNHKRGANKARVFYSALGYTQENYQPLIDQIRDKVLDAEAIPGKQDQYGQRYTVTLEIEGIDVNQRALVLTGWIVVPKNSDVGRSTTAYVVQK
ncbi:MAG: DUF6883 domain-containing protein [Cyanobacteria bacterium P01_D01_bin.73]